MGKACVARPMAGPKALHPELRRPERKGRSKGMAGEGAEAGGPEAINRGSMMLKRWRIARKNRAIVERVYQALVTLTRDPRLYEHCGLADTFSGRFEALAIHMFLFLRRCRGDASLDAFAQDVVDRFILDVDASIRELGVGDQSVPKRMRKLTGVFYERVKVYDAAFDAEAKPNALRAAVVGRALAETVPEDAVGRLVSYILAMSDRMAAVSAEDILSGSLKLGD